MKTNFSNISGLLNKLLTVLALLMFVAVAPSCDNEIYDYDTCEPEGPEDPGPDNPGPDDPNEPGPAAYYVRFIFDMNLLYKDAFSTNVNSVDLYVFNESGAFLTKYHEEGLPLKNDGYLMELTDLPAGTYELIAWCGVNNGYFTVPTVISNRSSIDCTLAAPGDVQSRQLPGMFHGVPATKTVTYTEEPGEQIKDVYLTKDTNNINVTIQHQDGLEFAKDRFTATIKDNNGYMLYDNSVPASNQMITYKPYRTVYGTVDYENTTGNYLQVEFSTSRLMDTHDATLEIMDTEAGEVIYSFPVINWALKLRSLEHKGMGEQEYLDRQDQYNLLVLLKNDPNGSGWIGADVRILDWHVKDDSSDLK